MPTCIRAGVFETNSSSSHSICLVDCDFEPSKDLYISEDNICRVCAGEFGWEMCTYNDAITKASYCLTHAKSLPTYHLGTGRPELEMLKRVIEREVGVPCVFVPLAATSWRDDSSPDWGYIDHQSIEETGGPMADVWVDDATLRNFIFNPACELITDNDNH